MPNQLTAVLCYLRHTAGIKMCDQQCDAQLLQKFLAQRNEDAFAVLLQRHGPMVFAVCRQVLGNAHDAEDAFQATFLVLARQARSIRKPEALAAWLHRVAVNLARTAKANIVQRQSHERQTVLMSPSKPADEVALADAQSLIQEEVDHLPQKYRVPIVCCYLEGKTHEEAARQLGWPVGTVKGRLSRARHLLRTRLSRRGLVLSGGAVAAALAQSAAMGQVPIVLLGHTLQAAVSFVGKGTIAAGIVSPQALALANGALQTMTVTKLSSAFVTMIAIGIFGLALGVLGFAASFQPGKDSDAKPGDFAAAREIGRFVETTLPEPGAVKEKDKQVAESKAVEVNGLKFVALVPKRSTAPAPGGTRSFDLGLRVTNVSDKPLLLRTFDVILPRLYALRGKQVVEVEMGSRRKDTPKLTPAAMLAPGASWTWRPKAELSWTNDRAALELSGRDGLGVLGSWFFTTLKQGKYRLTVEYANKVPKEGDIPLWVGKATTGEMAFEILPPNAEQKDADQADLKNLDGTWRLVAAEHGGRALPPENFGRNTHWVFSGTTYTHKSGLRGLGGKLTLDSTKNPKWIDLDGGDGRLLLHGIYELKDDTLRLILVPAAEKRPTEFKTKEGNEQWIQIQTYTRVKAEDKP